jgi:hypothetical protein
VSLDRGQLLDLGLDLFFDDANALAYLPVAHREEEDKDQQSVEKDQQEHEPLLAVHFELFSQAMWPPWRDEGPEHGSWILCRTSDSKGPGISAF